MSKFTSLMAKLTKDKIVAKPGFHRWLIAPAAVAIHLCIGSVYAWSIFNPALIKQFGVVASSADDWSFASVVWVFSTAIVFLGFAAAIAGKWLEEVGPRATGFLAAFLWGRRFSYWQHWYSNTPIMVNLSWLRGYRRLWAWSGLCDTSQYFDPMVP